MWHLVFTVEKMCHGGLLNKILSLENEERSCCAISLWGLRAVAPEGRGSLLGSRDPWEQDTWILAWPASSSPMAWVLGATGLGPNPSPSSFFGRRLQVRTPPAVSLLGVCSPQARRLGGRGDHGLEPTPDHACWDARDPGMLMGPGDIYWGWNKGGIDGDQTGVGART